MQGTEGTPGAEGCPQGLIQGSEFAAHEDVVSSNESLRERVLKIVADRGIFSSGSQREGDQREGEQSNDMGAPVLASGEEVAQPTGLSQLASAPSSTDAMPGVGIQVQRTRYFLLLEIDGLLMWQWFGQSGPLRDSRRLTVQREMHYFLRLGLKEFLEFYLVNFEVIFWTTAESRTLVPQYERLLEACPAMGENRATSGRRWCDQSTYLNPVTRKYENYLKRLDRVLTDMRCLGEYYHLQDYFLLIDPLAYRNVLNNPFSAYHPTMYHRKSKEEERDAPIPYFRHAVQPFLEGLLDSGKIVPQYCALNDRHGWRRLFPGDDKFASYKQVFPEFAAGFEIAAPATPWCIPLSGMNKFYTLVAPPPHAPSLGT